jgi:hypothetical protein
MTVRGGLMAAQANETHRRIVHLSTVMFQSQKDVRQMGDGQLYELRIVASGEVRDADGNLIPSEPIETTVVLTEEEAQAFNERHQP